VATCPCAGGLAIGGWLDYACACDTGELDMLAVRAGRFAHQLVAECFLRFGDVEAGLEHVRRSVAAGLEDLTWLRHCPLFAPHHATGALDRELAAVEERAEAIGRAWEQSSAVATAS